jgi:capsular exopolysaccharide synthesis family protein
MDNKNTKNEEIEIDLSRLFAAVVKRAWLIAVVALLCAVVTLAGTVLLIAPKYQSSAMIYVNNSSLSIGDVSVGGITTGDISASKSLVKTYIVILTTRETLNDVIDYADVDLTYAELKGMIKAEAVDSTEVFRVTVTSTDPEEATKVAAAIAYILPRRIANIIQGTSAVVVDSAVMPTAASSPNYTRNTMIGFLFGILAVMAAIVMRELLDNTIRSEEDVTQNCQHPILAPVPDLLSSGKGQYGYARDGQKDDGGADKRTLPLLGKNIGFAAQESYKLLRTKLQFSFADDNACHVIGISSALPGEGKSVTAINLAYSLSELGKRVILLDADMRRPTLAEKLNINKKPGLSSYLTGQSDLNELVQNCNIAGDEKAFHVIAAGQNPPNPVELLSSSRMDLAIETLRKQYDYVIFDLPPIVEVSDTLAIAQKVDGVLVVVRQNHCNRLALNMTLRQLAFVDAKVLGVVFNAVADEGRPYGRKYYRYYKNRYGRYYNRYYRHHYYGHPSDGKSKKGGK